MNHAARNKLEDLLIAGIVLASAFVMVQVASLRANARAEARICVRASDGTDTAVEACYADRGLPQP